MTKRVFTPIEIQQIKNTWGEHAPSVQAFSTAMDVSWDTGRRWLHNLGLRPDPTGHVEAERIDWYLYWVQVEVEGRTINVYCEGVCPGQALEQVLDLENESNWISCHVKRVSKSTHEPSAPQFTRMRVQALNPIESKAQIAHYNALRPYDRKFAHSS